MTTLIIVAVGLVAVLVLGFLAIRSWLVTPIQQLSKTMNVLADGDFAATVDGVERRDEVGTMAKAVQVFKDNGLRAKELERDAESTRTTSEAERSRAAQADHLRAKEMAQATSGLADGLKHLSSGDLTFRLDEAFAGDFESLRADFNAAVDQLAVCLHCNRIHRQRRARNQPGCRRSFQAHGTTGCIARANCGGTRPDHHQRCQLLEAD